MRQQNGSSLVELPSFRTRRNHPLIFFPPRSKKMGTRERDSVREGKRRMSGSSSDVFVLSDRSHLFENGIFSLRSSATWYGTRRSDENYDSLPRFGTHIIMSANQIWSSGHPSVATPLVPYYYGIAKRLTMVQYHSDRACVIPNSFAAAVGHGLTPC